MSRWVIEKDEERQNVTDLSGYEEWTVISEVPDEIPDHQAEIVDGAWVVPLDIQKERKWDSTKLYRDIHRHMGCMTPKGRMDNDFESQMKLNGAVAMAQLLGDSFSVGWTMEDNSVIDHDAEEIKAAGVAVGMFDAQCHAVGQALRAAIDAAPAEATLEAIDIPGAPWPV